VSSTRVWLEQRAARLRAFGVREALTIEGTTLRRIIKSTVAGTVAWEVAALINKHLIELGIDPQIPPVELLDPDFVEQVTGHAQGRPRAKASEMEHAIRKHCTIHFDEDPAFFKRMSEKLCARRCRFPSTY